MQQNNRINIVLERLEPCAGKLASTVLRRAAAGNGCCLSDFAFVSRQQRISVEDQDFYLDLVFYNFKLKFFLLIDIKLGRLSHQDVGQMDTYVRIYDKYYKSSDDGPTIGLILCSEKSEAVAKYSVLSDSKQLFSSKYLPYLPTEEELRIELQRERSLMKEEDDTCCE